MFGQVTIVGVGLIGGSLGLALRRRQMAAQVVGVDKDPHNLRLAKEAGAIDCTAADLAEGLAGAEVVVLAVPVMEVLELLPAVGRSLSPGTVVTDVGSTKAAVCRRAAEAIPSHSWFVGGHPMAGSEQAGMAGADPYLFENAYYILTPLPATPEGVLLKVRDLAAGVGARVVEMDPHFHDAAVAFISHLPHLAAVALANALAEAPQGESCLSLAAGGFRDTTRVASGNPQMWKDIFLTNSRPILEALACFRAQLERLEEAIRGGREEEILYLLQKAKKLRDALPARARGYLPAMYEIVVAVPDRPGMLARLTGQLGQAGINIADIEILRVREGEGGSIRLAFATPAEQEQAATILRRAGYQVVKRE